MSSRSSMRWRLVAWVTGVVLAVGAIVFVVVYENTGAQLRGQIDHDVGGDVRQLSQAMRTLATRDPSAVLAGARRYVRAQPFSGTSPLLFVVIPGLGTVSNHPEVFGGSRADDGESMAAQQSENADGQTLLSAPPGLSTREIADAGKVRVATERVRLGTLELRTGAGAPLVIVARAQHSLAKSFALAGALGLVLALLASYLAAASVSLPLRRMARVAARVEHGDLHPRMKVPATAGSEVRVLAESFNHMLDRLADAFAAQRDFIADASHELRTPLTVIAGQLEVLAAQKHPSADDIRRVQRLVSAEVARTSRLVDDMLLLAHSERRDFLQLQKIELAPFIEDLWSAIAVTEPRRYELDPLPMASLTADPDRLAQALRNLIRNAIEHTTAPDGLVRLEVDVHVPGRVWFTVIDDGPGIDPEQRERVFERFHRTDEARARVAGGAGLGLPIVRAIAEAHGGTVRVLDPPAGGASVRLDLPGLEPLRPAAGKRPVAAPAR